VCDELPVDHVRVRKISDTYHIAAQERQQEAGSEPFFITYHVVHAVTSFLTVQR
jgi:hypothetical protein